MKKSDVFKVIGKVAEQVAVGFVPGGAMIDKGIHVAIDEHKSKTERVDGVLDAAQGAIQAIEAIDGVEIADEIGFRAGCGLVEQGLQMIHGSLRRAPVEVRTP